MKKSYKITLGILTPLPILAIILGIVAFFVFLIPNLPTKGQIPTTDFPVHMFEGIAIFYVLIIGAVIFGFLINICYFIHLVRTEQINKDHKTLWVVLFLIFNVLAMIVYWFLVVWPEPEKISKAKKT
jgi:nitric oxide reductase large subunit